MGEYDKFRHKAFYQLPSILQYVCVLWGWGGVKVDFTFLISPTETSFKSVYPLPPKGIKISSHGSKLYISV